MIAARLAIAKAQAVLEERVRDLIARATSGDADAFHELYQAVPALVACASVPATREPGELLTSRQLEQHMGISSRTRRRLQARGQLSPAKAGGRGRTHLWPAAAAR